MVQTIDRGKYEKVRLSFKLSTHTYLYIITINFIASIIFYSQVFLIYQVPKMNCLAKSQINCYGIFFIL